MNLYDGLGCIYIYISMVVSGSPKRWQVAYNPPIGSIYHLYIAFWGGYMLPTTFQGNQKQPLNIGPQSDATLERSGFLGQ